MKDRREQPLLDVLQFGSHLGVAAGWSTLACAAAGPDMTVDPEAHSPPHWRAVSECPPLVQDALGQGSSRHAGEMLRPVNTRTGPPTGTGHVPLAVLRLLEQHGGIVSTRELNALGVWQTPLELYRDYGSLQAVRQGWHCAPDLPEVLRLSWRFGGPLACTSALRYHQLIDSGQPITAVNIPQPLHVVVRSNTARVPSPSLLARRWGIDEPREPIIHWSTAEFRSGNRQAVSRTVALKQADCCHPRAE